MSPATLAFLFMIGMLGSGVAKGISVGLVPWWCPVFTSAAVSLMWGWTARGVRDLPWASAVFNVVSMVGFMVGSVMLGSKLSPAQVCGLVMTLVGIGLMSL